MKLSGVSISQGINKYNSNNKVVSKKGISKVTDKIEISSVGKSLSKYSVECNKLDPKEREHKIREIKEKIEKGTYKIDSKLIAQKILTKTTGEK